MTSHHYIYHCGSFKRISQTSRLGTQIQSFTSLHISSRVNFSVFALISSSNFLLRCFFLHFNYNYHVHCRLPDGPSEPDLESVEPADPKFIPLEDVSRHLRLICHYEEYFVLGGFIETGT